MSLGSHKPGFGSVSDYSTPGLPWVTTQTITGNTQLTFPSVTQEITVKSNSGAGSVTIAFTSAGLTGTNNYQLALSQSITFSARVKTLYLTAVSSQVSVYAALSTVPADSCPLISSSMGPIFSGVG